MKKYISILSLFTAFLMQSCESSDSDFNTTEQKELNNEVPNRESSRIENNVLKKNDSDQLDSGDDDEPKRDKQHWRITQDTIGRLQSV